MIFGEEEHFIVINMLRSNLGLKTKRINMNNKTKRQKIKGMNQNNCKVKNNQKTKNTQSQNQRSNLHKFTKIASNNNFGKI